MGYTTDDLINRIRLWSASSTGTPPSVSDTDVLDLLNSELGSVIVPMIMSAQGEWLIDYDDVAITHAADVQAITIPSRAVLGKLREIKIYDPSSQSYFEVPVLAISQLENGKTQYGCYFIGDTLYLSDVKRWPDTYVIRLFYYRRPNDLVDVDATGPLTQWNMGVGTVVGAETLFGTSANLDFILPAPPFSLVASDVACSISGNAVIPAVIPDGVAVGNIVSLSGQASIPMIPLEYHNILCQGATIKLLEVSGDAQALQIAMGKYKQMVEATSNQASNRVTGESKIIRSRRGLF